MSERTNTAVWVESRQRWQINVQKDGVRKTFTCAKPGRTGQREANKKADEWLGGAVTAVTKVSDAWERFERSKRNISETEYRNAESFGRLYFLPALGKRKLSTLTEQDLQDVLNNAFRHPVKRNSPLSRKTLQNMMACERQFIKYCRKSKWISLYPEDLRVPSAARYCGKSVLKVHDFIKVLNIDTTVLRGQRVKDDFINYYRFQLLSGLRPGELRGLKWSDVKDNVCAVKRSINFQGNITHGKNENALRSFVITPMAMAVLDAQRELTGDIEYIFPMTSMQQYYKRWHKYQIANNIEPISLYEMRHTFVSAIKSLPEGQLKQLVGHSKSMDTYGTYSHVLETDAEQTADAVQDIFDSLLNG